jgi:hypothetical protein
MPSASKPWMTSGVTPNDLNDAKISDLLSGKVSSNLFALMK